MAAAPTLVFTSPSGTPTAVRPISAELLSSLPHRVNNQSAPDAPPSSHPTRSRPTSPANSRPGEPMHEQAHKGRTLRVNTLHQRVYHGQESPPVVFPLVGSSPPATEIAMVKDSLHPSLPIPPSSSKDRFLNRTGVRASYLISLLFRLPDSPQVWLALYFTLNLSLTLYNKSVLVRFPFPYTLTALHALCGTIGTYVMLRLEFRTNGSRAVGHRPLTSMPMPNLNGRELIVLFLFSILYTLNIVVSNASLRVVTVPFHQVVRASTPFFTILFAAILLGRRCSKNKIISLIPVVAGVGFATYGDYYFTAFGFFLTLLGTLLAALKTTLTNVILAKPNSGAPALPVSSPSGYFAHQEPTPSSKLAHTAFPPSFFTSLIALATSAISHKSASPASSIGYHPLKSLPPTPAPAPLSPGAQPVRVMGLPKLTLSPLHLLYLLSPLAFVQTTLLAHFTGELDRVHIHLAKAAAAGAGMDRTWLLLNGVLAFFLNVVSFNANKRVGPLGMSVAANCKQVLTILFAVVIFDLTITAANGVGIALTLLGGALYAAVELHERADRKSRVG